MLWDSGAAAKDHRGTGRQGLSDKGEMAGRSSLWNQSPWSGLHHPHSSCFWPCCHPGDSQTRQSQLLSIHACPLPAPAPQLSWPALLLSLALPPALTEHTHCRFLLQHRCDQGAPAIPHTHHTHTPKSCNMGKSAAKLCPDCILCLERLCWKTPKRSYRVSFQTFTHTNLLKQVTLH